MKKRQHPEKSKAYRFEGLWLKERNQREKETQKKGNAGGCTSLYEKEGVGGKAKQVKCKTGQERLGTSRIIWEQRGHSRLGKAIKPKSCRCWGADRRNEGEDKEPGQGKLPN